MVEHQEERCFAYMFCSNILVSFTFCRNVGRKKSNHSDWHAAATTLSMAKDKAENPFKFDGGKWKISFISIIQQILHTSDAVSLNIRVRQRKIDVIRKSAYRMYVRRTDLQDYKKKNSGSKEKQLSSLMLPKIKP